MEASRAVKTSTVSAISLSVSFLLSSAERLISCTSCCLAWIICCNFLVFSPTCSFIAPNSSFKMTVSWLLWFACERMIQMHTWLLLQFSSNILTCFLYVLQVPHRVDQLVFLQSWGTLMRLQVSLTVTSKTIQAGLQGLELGPRADVTRHHLYWFGRFLWFSAAGSFYLYWLSELICHQRNKTTDMELRSLMELLLTHRTMSLIIVVPVHCDTCLEDVVSTWSKDKLLHW